MWHATAADKYIQAFCCKEGTRPLGKPMHRWSDMRYNLEQWNGKAMAGLFWLMRGTNGEVMRIS
jgi:hypothetical protein